MARVCIASDHASLEDALRCPELDEARRDSRLLVELRLDGYADLTLEGLRRALSHFGASQTLVTFRSAAEGGRNPTVDDASRVDYLCHALRAGAAYVDVEWQTLNRHADLRELLQNAKTGASQLVVSYHDFRGTPPYRMLRTIRQAAEEMGADIVKLAVTSPTIIVGLPLARLLAEDTWSRPLLGIAMGEAGLWSRLLTPRFPKPAPFAFARSQKGGGTAPGQPVWRDLLERYRFDQMGPDWPVYGVIGSPIAHSLSPLMHNAALAAADLPGVYVPLRVDDDPIGFLRDMAPALGLVGLSVTLPHKEAAMAACASTDPLAAQIGAVNTLVRRDGGWFGCNTDARAAAGALEDALGAAGSLKGREVIILGAGGAARAVAFGVTELGARVAIHNRTAARGEALARAVGGIAVSRADIASRPAVAVVNTTSLGMHPNPDAAPLEADELPAGALVFDTVYNPRQTKLLREAAQRGVKTLDGVVMFVRQGAAQLRLFTGRDPPVEVMRQAVVQALG